MLQFKPDTAGTTGLPDITLEDGDRFVIPPVPASVNIVGAVNDQNSFLYARDSRVGRYLQMAGGLTRDADRKREFVIRANGEVVGYDATKGVWGSEFNNLALYAGDTIVIPEKTFKPPLGARLSPVVAGLLAARSGLCGNRRVAISRMTA